jgi:heptosyltransferase-3
MSLPNSEIQRLLIYRLGSLGDAMLALPALHLIRDRFPRAEITLLTHIPADNRAAALVSILEHTNLHQGVISYPLGVRTMRQLMAMRAQIAERRFQLAVHLAESRGAVKGLRDYLFFRACGISRVVGLWRRGTELPAPLRPGWLEWEAEQLMRRLPSLGSVDLNEDKWWDLHLTAGELETAETQLDGFRKPFIAVSLGTKVDVNHWTEANWSSLLRRAHSNWPGLSLVLVGARDEFETSERCSRGWLAPKLNLCGRVPPRVSAAILRQAVLFVGHDSGPLHLAATVGVPCVGIYSARHEPGRWFPRGKNSQVIYHRTPCAGCGLNECLEHAKKCILSITVEEVLEAIDHQLSNRRDAALRLHRDTACLSGIRAAE